MTATTVLRVLAAVESGRFTTQRCVAAEVGVSPERVRQILNASGDTEFGHRAFRLEWRCPDCGDKISITRSVLEELRRMPAHCRRCARKYCWYGGHLLSEYANKKGSCRLCMNAHAREIIEVRTCVECGKDLEISRGQLGQIKFSVATGEFHKDCYAKVLRRQWVARRRAWQNTITEWL